MGKGKQKKKARQTTRQKEPNKSKVDRRESTYSNVSDTWNETADSVFQMLGNLKIEDENLSQSLSNRKTNQSTRSSSNSTPKGLRNLGNTCYLNSVIQVLAHTPLFCDYFDKRNSNNYEWTAVCYSDIVRQFTEKLNELLKPIPPSDDEEPEKLIEKSEPETIEQEERAEMDEMLRTKIDQAKKLQLQTPTLLVSCFVRLLHELRSRLSSQVSPNNFWREITNVVKRFQGYDQQDSHEFLRCLLDAIKNNETRRQKKTILTKFNVNIQKEQPDAKTSEHIKLFGFASNHTLIDAFFGGQCISSLKCEECESTSQIFEPFYDLSLPITEDRHHVTVRKGKKQARDEEETDESDQKSKPSHKPKSDYSRLMDEDDEKLTPRKRKERKVLKKEARRKERERLKTMATNLNDACQAKKDALLEEEKAVEANESKAIYANDDVNYDAKQTIDEEERSEEAAKGREDAVEEEEEEEVQSVKDGKDSLMEEDDSLQSAQTDPARLTKKMSDGNCSDDEASGKDFDGEALDEQSEDKSLAEHLDKNKSTTSRSRLERAQTNSTDSGINYPTLASDGDLNTTNQLKLIETTAEQVDRVQSTERVDDLTNESQNEEPNGLLSNHDEDADSESEESSEHCNSQQSDSDTLNANQRKNANEKFTEESLFENQRDRTDKRIRTNSTNENQEEQRQKAKWTLSTISSKNESMPSTSILSCLSRFTSLELLGGANKINCENCTLRHKRKTGQDKKIYTHASKRMLIAIPPPILTLHLKRFEVSTHRLSLCKVNRHVPFPLLFDLSPYISNLYKVAAQAQHPNQACNQVIYYLYGIVEHSGSLRSGHYKAYVRHQSKENESKSLLSKFVQMTPFLPKMEETLEQINARHFEAIEEKMPHFETNLDGKRIRELLPSFDEQKWYHISDMSVTPVSLAQVLKAQAYLLFYERIL